MEHIYFDKSNILLPHLIVCQKNNKSTARKPICCKNCTKKGKKGQKIVKNSHIELVFRTSLAYISYIPQRHSGFNVKARA